MRELLYFPHMNPPGEVLHHAILYRDSISVIEGTGTEVLDFRATQAFEAGMLKVYRYSDFNSDIIAGQRAREVASRLAYLGSSINERERAAAGPRFYFTRLNSLLQGGIVGCSARALRALDELESKVNTQWNFTDDLPPDTNTMRRAARAMGLSFGSTLPSHSANDDQFIRLAMSITTAFAIADHSRSDSSLPLVLLCHPEHATPLVHYCNPNSSLDHLLARVDLGRFLPQPPPEVDTAAVIAFRERYNDERKRLIHAVERLIKDAARAHGTGEPMDIERDVREELNEALTDVEKAGRRPFKGWVRRAAWFIVASGAGAIAGPAGAAAGSVAANWSSNPVTSGAQDSDYAYLYRVQNALDDFTRGET